MKTRVLLSVWLVVTMIAWTVFLAGCYRAYRPLSAPTAQARPDRWTRQEFKAAVLGKTQEEVKQLLGNPDQVDTKPSAGEPGQVAWVYISVTYLPPATQRDHWVEIYFDGSPDERFLKEGTGPARFARMVRYSDGSKAIE